MIENLTTKKRDKILRQFGVKSHLVKVGIQEKVQSDEPMHQHIGLAYLSNGLTLHVENGSTHVGEEHDVVIYHATELRGSGRCHLVARILEDTKYDVTSLIETYINTKRRYEHDDFPAYYNALFDVLKPSFGTAGFHSGASKNARSFEILFQSTADSYLAIGTPWTGFLEAGVLHCALDQSGDAGKRIYEFSNRIGELAEQSRTLHLQMMCKLFEMLNGSVSAVITSKDLLLAGFDDSAEPQHRDYYDYV